MTTLVLVLLLAACVCFLLATLEVASRVNLLALGLLLFAAAEVVRVWPR